MAQYRIADPEELMECPYDRVHMVRTKRFQYHLMKCRQNYTGKDFVSCPFNAKHEMPRPEIRHHISICPDKAMLEPELTYAARKESGDNNIHKGCTDTPVYRDLAIPSNEDWDSEASEHVGVGPLHDRSYFGRVQFHDTTNMNRAQKKVMQDNRLTPEQKMAELAVQTGRAPKEADDVLRLPKTSSIAAAQSTQPQIQPREQPISSVFQYSLASGRGRGRGLANGAFTPTMPYGRGGSMAPQGVPVGIDRGLMQGGGIGRGQVAPPPGFCVPKVDPG